jgi:translation elongation factor EF-1beta
MLMGETVAKSVVTLDVKPWDDETNMDELIANVKAIEKGTSEHTP